MASVKTDFLLVADMFLKAAEEKPTLMAVPSAAVKVTVPFCSAPPVLTRVKAVL